jgi:hypothetical protein
MLITILGIMTGQKNYENFRFDLGKKESGNDYHAKNTLGYLGRYQFGMARLADFGLCERVSEGYSNNSFKWAKGYSEDTFLTNEVLQDEIFDKHVADLVKRIQKYQGSMIGTVQYKIYITLSGMVAASHLGGYASARDFIKYGKITVDSNGTSIKDYLLSFSGYDLKKVDNQNND